MQNDQPPPAFTQPRAEFGYQIDNLKGQLMTMPSYRVERSSNTETVTTDTDSAYIPTPESNGSMVPLTENNGSKNLLIANVTIESPEEAFVKLNGQKCQSPNQVETEDGTSYFVYDCRHPSLRTHEFSLTEVYGSPYFIRYFPTDKTICVTQRSARTPIQITINGEKIESGASTKTNALVNANN